MSKKTKQKVSGNINIGIARTPKKKTAQTDPFARIQLHPLEELEARDKAHDDQVAVDYESPQKTIQFPAPSTPVEINSNDLATQVSDFGNPNITSLETQGENSGNPNGSTLETQTDDFGNPYKTNLETQNFNIGNPKLVELETQIIETGNPNVNFLATQTKIFGNPNDENLGAIQPKREFRQPKKITPPSANQPKDFDLATQNIEKSSSQQFLKKYDEARSTEPLHARVEKSIAKRVRHFIVDHNFTLKEFIEVSSVKFMDEFGNPNENDLGCNQPYDDRRLRLLWKTRPFIINLYLAYNSVFNPKTKWSVKDDDAASRLNAVDYRLIELGIIQTQGNKNFSGKINSFGYYLSEIQGFIDLNLPEESIGVMLEINRKRWTQATKRELDLSFLPAKDESK